MKKISFILSLLLSFSYSAAPQKIEMIFLSPQKVAQLLKSLDEKSDNHFMQKIAEESIQENCIPMGEGCFHPQLGYIEKSKFEPVKKEPVLMKEEEMKLKTFNAIETNLIKCEKGNYFDIFCGQARTEFSDAEFEIWIDVSSSLRVADYNKDPNECHRKDFVSKVMKSCKSRVRISIFNTSIKEIGESSSVCLSYGSNDSKKMLQWLQNSNAKRLLIVTDIDEMSEGLKDFLDSHGAKMIGDGTKPFNSTDLVNYADDFAKSCK